MEDVVVTGESKSRPLVKLPENGSLSFAQNISIVFMVFCLCLACLWCCAVREGVLEGSWTDISDEEVLLRKFDMVRIVVLLSIRFVVDCKLSPSFHFLCSVFDVVMAGHGVRPLHWHITSRPNAARSEKRHCAARLPDGLAGLESERRAARVFVGEHYGARVDERRTPAAGLKS